MQYIQHSLPHNAELPNMSLQAQIAQMCKPSHIDHMHLYHNMYD
jgi:hypothetical protein